MQWKPELRDPNNLEHAATDRRASVQSPEESYRGFTGRKGRPAYHKQCREDVEIEHMGALKSVSTQGYTGRTLGRATPRQTGEKGLSHVRRVKQRRGSRRNVFESAQMGCIRWSHSGS